MGKSMCCDKDNMIKKNVELMQDENGFDISRETYVCLTHKRIYFVDKRNGIVVLNTKKISCR